MYVAKWSTLLQEMLHCCIVLIDLSVHEESMESLCVCVCVYMCKFLDFLIKVSMLKK